MRDDLHGSLRAMALGLLGILGIIGGVGYRVYSLNVSERNPPVPAAAPSAAEVTEPRPMVAR